MIASGLLHSAYLYGQFGDKDSGATSTRRQYVKEKVGNAAEALIYTYTSEKGSNPLTSDNRDFLILSLADLYDELLDLGSVYAPTKAIQELSDESDTAAVVRTASMAVNPEVGLQFESAIRRAKQESVPDCLTLSLIHI